MPAPRNRTLTVAADERDGLLAECAAPPGAAVDCGPGGAYDCRVCLGDAFAFLRAMPDACVDLAVADPPYNLAKDFHGEGYAEIGLDGYLAYVRGWLPQLARVLRPGGTLYVCSEWRGSAAVQIAAAECLDVRNRITWEREKGRGAKRNWKNAGEDIWFCTKGPDYHFDPDAVKLRRLVRAPYREATGEARGWQATEAGRRWRDTGASNLWTDLTVPFWSMPENTMHPTQKPEKLLAKLILASSRPGDLVFDPFAGSGSTLVAARKLGRRWLGVERNPDYAALAAKRLRLAAADPRIQGYDEGVFWERNSR